MNEIDALRQELETLKQERNVKDKAISLATILALFAGALVKTTDARMVVVFVIAAWGAAAYWCEYRYSKRGRALIGFCLNTILLLGAGWFVLVPVARRVAEMLLL